MLERENVSGGLRVLTGNGQDDILRSMNTTLSSRGQLVLTSSIRRRDHLRPGQSFEVERIDRGEYRLVAKEPAPNAGICDW